MLSPEPNVVRSAAFALSNLARGKEANIKALMDAGIAEPLLQLLQVKTDQGTMAEAAWTLTYLTAGGEFEQSFVSMGLIPKLVAAMEVLSKQKPHDSAVLTPLIRCLGNICTGPENIVTMATEDGTLLPTIGRLLQSDHRHIKKETLWAVSNMTEVLSVCEQIITLGLLPNIISCLDTTFDIKREAVVCLCNLAYHGATFCQQLIQHGAFPGVISMLKDADPAAVGLVLGFSDMILKNNENGKHLFEEHGGLTLLEPLEYHNNPTIHSQVAEFLETYFYHDADKGS
ncbi:importin subunit alpha-2-like isoform X1 [Asterias rubens]|uniref:importin subunit alpha-2-like isoform X1 n=2 Tax=Asterias rubens TaxID=7604 RepID=UPI001454F5CB|nr:importin subunit alpha-2-like isoform X1 [Asterias rubens]